MRLRVSDIQQPRPVTERLEEIHVPEWGGEVMILRPTIREWEEGMRQRPDEDHDAYARRVLQFLVREETGKEFFPADRLDAVVSEMTPKGLRELLERALDVAMGSEEDRQGKSAPTTS